MLDDVAVLSKVAAKKTTGVLGDDLALNAEQVSGVQANRELPVVWAVAKGSLLNKLILVPSALLISFFVPTLIQILLIIGGLYLCYEGAEKIVHKLMHSKQGIEKRRKANLAALADATIDIKALEQDKIKGAIRTDFVLSAEIIVIILGTVQDVSFVTQVTVLSLLAFAFTAGVYGFVAIIVKLDDIGLYFLRESASGNFKTIKKNLGEALLIFAPQLMKLLAIIGTAAMFLVGGGIIVHEIPFIHHFFEHYIELASNLPNLASLVSSIASIAINASVGIISGVITLLLFASIRKFKKR